MTRRGRGRPPHPDILTPAEWRVLEEVRAGGTNAEIAIKLGISPYTVKYHVSNILGKLELRNRRQIATWQPERQPVRLPQLVGARLRAFLAPLALLPKPLLGVAAATVVTLAAIPAIVMAILLTRPDEPVNVLLSPGPSPTPVAGTTATPTPSPTPAATPDPSPTPSPEPEASPTPEPIPEPTPEPTPEAPIESTPNALGIREIATDEAFVRLEYAPGERIAETTGVFFLDVETGTVEAWSSVDGLPLGASSNHRYLLRGDIVTDEVRGVLHDRETGRTFSWDQAALRFSYAGWVGEAIVFERLDGDADADVTSYVAVDASMDPETEFAIPADWFLDDVLLEDGLLLAWSSGLLHILDIDSGDRVMLDPGGSYHTARTGEGFALVDSRHPEGNGAHTCRILRYDLSGDLQSDVSVSCFVGTYARVHLSPDARLFATLTNVVGCCGWWGASGFYPAPLVLSIFDAATGDELMKVAGATFAGWLADSSGLVVETVRGRRVLGIDGGWISLPERLPSGTLHPSPTDPTRFIHANPFRGSRPTVAVVDMSDQVLASANLQAVPVWGLSWSASGHEVFFHNQQGRQQGAPGTIVPVLQPAIQVPPFDDSLTAEVVVDTCLNVRAEATTESEIVVCLPPERVVELVAHPTDGYVVEGPCIEDEEDLDGRCVWVHVLTEDGEEGWAYSDFLRWTGIPLVPDPAPPAPRG